MKNITRLGIAVFLIVILANAGCSDDPVSPTNENTKKALASAEIGSGGGTVETDDVSITIPSGAFIEKHTIAIYDFADDGAFRENAISSSFKISGLPESYSKPIQLKIKHSKQLSGNIFLASGVNWFSEMDGDSSIIYQLNSAIDSSGYIIGQLPTNDYSYLNKTSNNNFSAHPISIFISPLISYTELNTEHFKLSIPFTLSEHAQRIGDILENSYKIATNDLKLPYPLEVGRWKVTVKIQKEKVTGGFTSRNAILNINRELVSQSAYNEIQIALGNKLIEIGLWNIIYQNTTTQNNNIVQPGFFSLIASVQTWSEELFTTNQNYKYPQNFPVNFLAPFNGLRTGSGTYLLFPLDLRHSYGNASLIKYMVEDNRFGIQGIANTFRDIGKGQYPFAALINNFDGLFVEWFPEFFKKYVNGEIYNVSFDYFLNETKHIWNIENNNDTLKIFAASDPGVKFYPDLSAKLFKINLNNPDLDSSSNMLLSMKGPVTEDGLALVVFGIQNEEAIYLETAYAQDFEIPNLKEYYDNGMQQFLVVLVNSLGGSPFLGESDIDLTIKVNIKEQKVQFNHCSFNYVVSHDLHYEYHNSDGTASTDDYTKLISAHGFFEEGSMQGNIFNSSIHSDDGTSIIDQTVTVEFNADQSMLMNFAMTYSESFSRNGNVGTDVRSFSGENLMMTDNDNGRIWFSVSGENTCNHIKSVNYTLDNRYEDSTYWNTQKTTTTGLGTCGANDRMEISFWKE